MLKIEANTTHELIDFMWHNMTSGDLDTIRSFIDGSGTAESIKERIPDKELMGNEGWLIPVTPEKKKTDPKKEPPYDQETRKMIWSHRKASGMTGKRFDLWNKSFEGWIYTRQKTAYEKYLKSLKQDFGCCTEVAAVSCDAKITGLRADWIIMDDIVVDPNKKEKKMYNECKTDQRTEAQQAKDYLIHSLNMVMNQKLGELVYEFGIEQKYPKTVGELRQAYKDGWLKLNIPAEAKDSKRVYSWFDHIRFGDPTKKRDEEGYDAAVKAVQKAASDVKDQIVVMGPEKGLEALNAFKAETFH